jgi:predicted 3-demethylubiquinone-9 3-methyltransferase (glyoxalase superfamily)
MSKITPYLWFDNQAEEAAAFYVSLFENSAITSVERYPEGAPGPAGTAMIVNFTLDGRDYIALNGGPEFKFNESFSMFVSCDGQAEVDDLWTRLTADGGKPGQCGWLKDKWGLSWQIIPTVLPELLGSPDKERAGRVMQAMLKMQKIDVATLENA